MVSYSLALLCVLYVLGIQQNVHGIKTKPPILAVRGAGMSRSKDELAHITDDSTNKHFIRSKLFVKAGIDNFSSSSFIKSAGPVLLSAFCAAAIMYPMDLIRALQMANAGSGEKLSTLHLLQNFQKVHGFKGFFTQGLAPELARSTW